MTFWGRQGETRAGIVRPQHSLEGLCMLLGWHKDGCCKPQENQKGLKPQCFEVLKRSVNVWRKSLLQQKGQLMAPVQDWICFP
uniref:Uncharacterized protein n=1 Tax=Anguilla anguilla TaxID=7936 RepID=A0A0E9SQC5_ANGAN